MMNFCGQKFKYKIEHKNAVNERVLFLNKILNPED